MVINKLVRMSFSCVKAFEMDFIELLLFYYLIMLMTNSRVLTGECNYDKISYDFDKYYYHKHN